MVERGVRDAEAAGSNPVISTKEIASTFLVGAIFLFATGFETTSKLCDQRKQRVWENSPVDCSIAGEENPVISTKEIASTFLVGAIFLFATGFETTSKRYDQRE